MTFTMETGNQIKSMDMVTMYLKLEKCIEASLKTVKKMAMGFSSILTSAYSKEPGVITLRLDLGQWLFLAK